MKARTNKILCLGVDGMDPRLTRKYVDEGLMPNTKKYIERGAARHDLTMLGGHPTVTPPMWTTLAVGCYSNVHGITGFFRKGNEIDEIDYNLDSRLCKAEPVWNCLAEAGKKTLVWHWPGSAWPPTSDSENLYVVDGTAPGIVGQSTIAVETECMIGASEKIAEVKFMPKAPIEASAACVPDDSDKTTADDDTGNFSGNAQMGSNSRKALLWKENQFTTAATEGYMDKVQSPIKPASGWANAPGKV
jgi:predicted AlkP superfamily phosphohydrolase/phosphomutase